MRDARVERPLAVLAMALVSHVLAHDLVFLAAYGAAYRGVLDRTGHDSRWTTAVLVVLGLGLSLLAAALVRLYRLGVLARAVEAPRPRAALRAATLLHHLVSLWAGTAAIATAFFVVQENLEYLRAAEQLPGLTLLARGEPSALLVIAGVALAVAFVGALFRWRRDELVARLAAARRWPRAPFRTSRRVELADRSARGSILGRQQGIRAPPLPCPAGAGH